MTYKNAIGIILLPLLLIGAGCAETPEQKVIDLQNQKSDLKETSGYNACIKSVDDGLAKQKECMVAKLVANGYADGLDCIQEYENAICKNTTRYNAEVNANNECNDELADPKTLSYIDCMELLTK